MATLTIRKLDEKLKRELQVRAALNGRSMEAEVRDLLSGLVSNISAESGDGFGTAIPKRFASPRDADPKNQPRQFSSRPAKAGEENSFENGVQKKGLGTAIHNLFAPLGGVDLQIPPRRKSHRPIPTFE